MRHLAILHHDHQCWHDQQAQTVCPRFKAHMMALYQAHQQSMPEHYFETQGQYPHFILADRLLQHSKNQRKLQDCDELIYLWATPEYHSRTHLGPAIQHRHALPMPFLDIMDCGALALPYALQYLQRKNTRLARTAIMILEQKITACAANQPNSASLLILASPQHKDPATHHITAIHTWHHSASEPNPTHPDEKKLQTQLDAKKKIQIITNAQHVLERWASHPHVVKINLHPGHRYTGLMGHLQQSLHQANPAQWIALVIEHAPRQTLTLTWIQRHAS